MSKASVNPFYAGRCYAHNTFILNAETRLERAKKFNTKQCQAALKLAGLQKNVRTAIERRLRALTKH